MWQKGKPVGSITILSSGTFYVVFSEQYSVHNRGFSTREEAMEYRYRISTELGLTRNMYRLLDDHVEVKLQNDLIMKCDMEHLPLVEERIWTARKGRDKKTYYASCRESVKKEYKAALFHKVAFPEFKEIDHINRDGLDNRRINIREGTGNVNANNRSTPKNNTSGHMGVIFEDGAKSRWIAQWVDADGIKRKKCFGVKKYGSDNAKNMAIEYREKMTTVKKAALGMT